MENFMYNIVQTNRPAISQYPKLGRLGKELHPPPIWEIVKHIVSLECFDKVCN